LTDIYEIRKDIPLPAAGGKNGLCAAIRRMTCGDSIVVPAGQHTCVHASARSVGAKVKTKSNKDGTVTVWRVDSSSAPSNPVSAASSLPRPANYIGGRYVDSKWGPNLFVADLDEFGRMVEPPPIPAPAPTSAARSVASAPTTREYIFS